MTERSKAAETKPIPGQFQILFVVRELIVVQFLEFISFEVYDSLLGSQL